MKGVLKVMGPQGHTTMEWDTEDSLGTVDRAQRRFAELLLQGHVGFVTSETPARKLEAFDPQAERIVMTVPMSGG